MSKLVKIMIAGMVSCLVVGCSSSSKNVNDLDIYERIAFKIMSDHVTQYDVSRFELSSPNYEKKAYKNNGVDGYYVSFSGTVESSEMVWANKVKVDYWLSKDKKTYRPMYLKFDKNTILSKEIAKEKKDVYQVADIKLQEENMAITLNLYYTGQNGSAKKFVEEMESSGVASKIRNEKGNLGYHYFQSLDDPETILLVDSWESQEAIDLHHASSMMNDISRLREKYDLHMHVERFVSDDSLPEADQQFIRN